MTERERFEQAMVEAGWEASMLRDQRTGRPLLWSHETELPSKWLGEHAWDYWRKHGKVYKPPPF